MRLLFKCGSYLLTYWKLFFQKPRLLFKCGSYFKGGLLIQLLHYEAAMAKWRPNNDIFCLRKCHSLFFLTVWVWLNGEKIGDTSNELKKRQRSAFQCVRILYFFQMTWKIETASILSAWNLGEKNFLSHF